MLQLQSEAEHSASEAELEQRGVQAGARCGITVSVTALLHSE